jgi:hypothetical protein
VANVNVNVNVHCTRDPRAWGARLRKGGEAAGEDENEETEDESDASDDSDT